MATGQWPTLVDVASRTDAEGTIPVIAEMLSQCNEVYDDLPFVEANEKTGHEFVFRTSIPAGAWRAYNTGVGFAKSTTGKARVGLAMLEAWSQVDRALAEHSGNAQKFRYSEDVAFMEGMGQTITQTIIYGNTAVNTREFMGLATFYNTVSTANAQNAGNVLDGGGVGNNNTSIWLLGVSPETIFAAYPRGGKAGLDHEDRGDTNFAYDNLGNPFMAYTSWFRQQMGLVPKDWRWGVRVANIDVTNAGLAGSNALDLFVTMDEALLLLPKTTRTGSGITTSDAPDDPDMGVRTGWYVNRTLMHWMNVQAMRNRNVLLSLDDYAGKPTKSYRDFPIRTVDQIVNSEARVV